MGSTRSFIWFTIVVVGILVSSLAMISMGAACWGYCNTVSIVPQYLVITGSIFFFLLIMLLLLTFCLCTSSGDPNIAGPLKIVYGISVGLMYILAIVGTALMFVNSLVEVECIRSNSTEQDVFIKRLNRTVTSTVEDPSFCGDTLLVFGYSVFVIFHVLLFSSLMVAFYDNTK